MTHVTSHIVRHIISPKRQHSWCICCTIWQRILLQDANMVCVFVLMRLCVIKFQNQYNEVEQHCFPISQKSINCMNIYIEAKQKMPLLLPSPVTSNDIYHMPAFSRKNQAYASCWGEPGSLKSAFGLYGLMTGILRDLDATLLLKIFRHWVYKSYLLYIIQLAHS